MKIDFIQIITNISFVADHYLLYFARLGVFSKGGGVESGGEVRGLKRHMGHLHLLMCI